MPLGETHYCLRIVIGGSPFEGRYLERRKCLSRGVERGNMVPSDFAR